VASKVLSALSRYSECTRTVTVEDVLSLCPPPPLFFPLAPFLSLPISVLNSFVLLGLVTCIYASMAVGLFGEKEPLMFGKLSASMFTMFQVSSADLRACGERASE